MHCSGWLSLNEYHLSYSLPLLLDKLERIASDLLSVALARDPSLYFMPLYIMVLVGSHAISICCIFKMGIQTPLSTPGLSPLTSRSFADEKPYQVIWL